VLKAGDRMSGPLDIKTGSFATQQGFLQMGWNNNITRWSWVMESDGAAALYAYDSAGLDPRQALRVSGGVAGGEAGLRINGNIAWHSGNFNPDGKVTVDAGVLYNGHIRSYSSTTAGTLYFGAGGSNYLTFNGSEFAMTNALYVPNVIATSDERLKKNIRKAKPLRGIADLIELVTWEWRRKKSKAAPAGRFRGVLAQAIQKFAPQYVDEGPDGMLGVDKAGLALEGVVDNAARIRELEAQVAKLSAAVKKIR
jgi:hypothetical protein